MSQRHLRSTVDRARHWPSLFWYAVSVPAGLLGAALLVGGVVVGRYGLDHWAARRLRT